MNSKFWLAVLVAGVVANIMDSVVYGMWLSQAYFMQNPALFRQDTNIAWYIVGDFIAVFVFAWLFTKVSGAIGSAAKTGLYLGIFMNFPTWIFVYLMFNGFPYSLSWINTFYNTIWYVIIGVVLGAVMNRKPAAA